MKARLPEGFNSGANQNLNQLARQAQKMQEELDKVNAELDEKEYTASSGGNAVSVTVTGKNVVKTLEIKPEVVDPEDIEMLSDMILAAVNEAIRMAAAERESRVSSVTGGMNIPGMF